MSDDMYIKELFAYAESSAAPPRVKQFKRITDSLIQAGKADQDRLRQVIEIANQMQADRDGIAVIASKLYLKLLEFDEIVPNDGSHALTDTEFRLYAGARINQSFAQFMGKPLTEENIKAMGGLAEEAFNEVLALGCQQDVVNDMRAHFQRSFEANVPEDKKLEEITQSVEEGA